MAMMSPHISMQKILTTCERLNVMMRNEYDQHDHDHDYEHDYEYEQDHGNDESADENIEDPSHM